MSTWPAGSPGQGSQHDSDRTLADHQHRLVRREVQAAHALEAGIQRLDKDSLGKWNAVRDLYQPALDDPVHHSHVPGKTTAGRFKSRGAADPLVYRALGEGLLAAVVTTAAGDMVEDGDPIAHSEGFNSRSQGRDRAYRFMAEDAGRGV